MRKRRFFVGVVAGLALSVPAGVQASCIRQTDAQRVESADVIFVGTALEGPTETGIQRFRVERYVKGGGPNVARVATGVVARPDGSGSITSVSLDVRAGQRWRIYALERAGGVLQTSACAGSVTVEAAAGDSRSDPSTAAGGSRSPRAVVVALAALMLVIGGLAAMTIGRGRRAASRTP